MLKSQGVNLFANLQISPDFQAHQKKIWMALYLGGCGRRCGRRCLYADI